MDARTQGVALGWPTPAPSAPEDIRIFGY